MQYKSIKFSIGGFFVGREQVVFNFVDSKIYVGRKTLNGLDWRCLSDDETNIFLEDFAKINVEKWEDKYINTNICDGEEWSLDIEYLSGETKNIYGCNSYPLNWNNFINFMDRFIPIIDAKRIEHLTIKFFKKLRMDLIDAYDENVPAFVDLEINETIDIDRKNGNFIMTRNVSKGNNQDNYEKIEVCKPHEVELILDDIFNIDDRPKNVKEVSSQDNETTYYSITVKYHDLQSLQMEGLYNRYELPQNWNIIIKSIKTFLSNSGYYEILNTNYTGGILENEVIYLSVVFNDYSEVTYYYQTDDENINVGDMVIVPVGNGKDESRAMVVDVKIYDKADVPYPLNKTKKIIRVM